MSKNAIDYLRNKLHFDGVVISDDMVMKGVSNFGDVEACLMGIRAGINLFIYRFADKNTIEIIESVYKIALDDVQLQDLIEKSYEKIINLKKKYLYK